MMVKKANDSIGMGKNTHTVGADNSTIRPTLFYR
jgi:hypothetical protein